MAFFTKVLSIVLFGIWVAGCLGEPDFRIDDRKPNPTNDNHVLLDVFSWQPTHPVAQTSLRQSLDLLGKQFYLVNPDFFAPDNFLLDLKKVRTWVPDFCSIDNFREFSVKTLERMVSRYSRAEREEQKEHLTAQLRALLPKVEARIKQTPCGNAKAVESALTDAAQGIDPPAPFFADFGLKQPEKEAKPPASWNGLRIAAGILSTLTDYAEVCAKNPKVAEYTPDLVKEWLAENAFGLNREISDQFIPHALASCQQTLKQELERIPKRLAENEVLREKILDSAAKLIDPKNVNEETVAYKKLIERAEELREESKKLDFSERQKQSQSRLLEILINRLKPEII